MLVFPTEENPPVACPPKAQGTSYRAGLQPSNLHNPPCSNFPLATGPVCHIPTCYRAGHASCPSGCYRGGITWGERPLHPPCRHPCRTATGWNASSTEAATGRVQGTRVRSQGAQPTAHNPPCSISAIWEEGRMHKAFKDKSSEHGLNLSGSWQQGHSTAYNTQFEQSRLQRIYPIDEWNCHKSKTDMLLHWEEPNVSLVG